MLTGKLPSLKDKILSQAETPPKEEEVKEKKVKKVEKKTKKKK